MAYICEECGTSFPKLSLLLQHQRTEKHWKKLKCDTCDKVFNRKDNLDRHKAKHRNEVSYHCDQCKKSFLRLDNLQRHITQKHFIGGGGQKRHVDDEEIPAKRMKESDDPREFYSITKLNEQHMEKFKTTASTYKVNFKDLEVTDNIVATLNRLFTAIFDELTTGAKPEDLIRMVIQSPTLDYPIIIPFDPLPKHTSERFMSEIERVLQSNEDFTIDQSLTFEVTHVNMPAGGAGKRCHYVDLEKTLKEKQCFIRIQNDDDLCCARAIVTAKARIDQHEKWNSIRQGRDVQKQLAEELHRQACVPLGSCGIEEIKKFQKVLVGYQIYVVSADHFNGIIYDGLEADKKLYLYHHDHHYDVITSMPAFLNKNYFCTKCRKGYDHMEKHSCNNICHSCKKVHTQCEEQWVHCNKCNRFFRGETCFELHQKVTANGNSTCRTYNRCNDCGKTINKRMSKKPHVCGSKYCEMCQDFFEDGHQCYMKSENQDELSDNNSDIENIDTFIFFDLECRQQDIVQCEKGYERGENGICIHCKKSKCGAFEHIANLCVVHKVCTLCMDGELNERSECEMCGKNEMIFSGLDTIDTFCSWLFSEDNNNATVICHNFQGYDSYPILQYLYKNAIVPTVIPNGAKIMSLIVSSCKIKMIDSINFLPMALSKLPAMFGFSELCKGYFPHLFNRLENETVVLDHLPDIKYYNPDAMKPDTRAIFMEWYEFNKNTSFDFQHEILKYCRSDVDILRRCCLKFRADFLKITGVDPFRKNITIASACQTVFRTNFLKENTIGIIPTHGYNPEQVQSVKALQWVKYMSHSLGIRIQHARNGGEKVIGPYKVDGYYETKDQKVVLEFHGDFWHGNPTLYASSTVNPVNKFTMGELYQNTLTRQRYIEELGYTYVSIWESEFEKMLKENDEMRSFVEQLDMVTPLQPREAFFGGRTEAFTLYKEASDDETIQYYDVTSLYPFINKTGKIPLGHPSIITERFAEITQYEGLIKCKVIPPRDLFIPVLPCKMNGKLLFPLCKTCAETCQQTKCLHTNEERAIIGTWVTDEVKKAIEKGYILDSIYEVWHFDSISQYDPDAKEGGLFTEYVNTFLKIKQEKSGWPKWCTSEEQKRTYIQQYYEKEGILLDYHNIEKNPGMRALAKLMLNSFWGKFGQRLNKNQVEFIDDPVVYFEKLTSDREEVTSINFVSDEMVEVRWKYKDEFVEPTGKTNVVIAAYTTAQARLKLYSYLEKLGPRALYADTDSVVFTLKPGDWIPSLGDYLGDLTDEIPGNQIKTFVASGPKSYTYQLKHPDENGKQTQCKVKGITLNFKNQNAINFETIKDMVTSPSNKTVTVTDSHKICRDRDQAKLLTLSQTKQYRIVFDKRVRDGCVSYPYGY